MVKNGKIVIGYRHAGIIVNDMEQSLNFYSNILGLEVLQDFSDNSEYINIITGTKNADVHMIKMKTNDGAIIEILQYKNYPTKIFQLPIYNVGLCHIALRVENAEEAYNKLVKHGITVLSKPVLSSEGIAKVFFCLDPNGVRIELVEMLQTQK